MWRILTKSRSNVFLKMIDIGQRIKDEVVRRQYSITLLATQLGCDRKSVYRLFNRTSLDTHLLLRLSLILKHNFFEEFYSHIQGQLSENDDCGKCATDLDNDLDK